VLCKVKVSVQGCLATCVLHIFVSSFVSDFCVVGENDTSITTPTFTHVPKSAPGRISQPALADQVLAVFLQLLAAHPNHRTSGRSVSQLAHVKGEKIATKRIYRNRLTSIGSCKGDTQQGDSFHSLVRSLPLPSKSIFYAFYSVLFVPTLHPNIVLEKISKGWDSFLPVRMYRLSTDDVLIHDALARTGI